ncbi:hypothetical protein [Mycoplasmopsis iners]|uniref:hypothetical protein n=1 Tax=Mycoplasmopsis iners TaxID=76630 RepID=UPI0004961668|nr:hypothetical protein [Mycoplasmopsis iners]
MFKEWFKAKKMFSIKKLIWFGLVLTLSVLAGVLYFVFNKDQKDINGKIYEYKKIVSDTLLIIGITNVIGFFIGFLANTKFFSGFFDFKNKRKLNALLEDIEFQKVQAKSKKQEMKLELLKSKQKELQSQAVIQNKNIVLYLFLCLIGLIFCLASYLVIV